MGFDSPTVGNNSPVVGNMILSWIAAWKPGAKLGESRKLAREQLQRIRLNTNLWLWTQPFLVRIPALFKAEILSEKSENAFFFSEWGQTKFKGWR